MIQVLLLLSVLLSQSIARDYEGNKVISISLKTNEDMDFISKLADEYNVDIWRGPSIVVPTHIMLTQETIHNFTEKVREHGLEHSVIIENVQKDIDDEFISNAISNYGTLPDPFRTSITDRFATYEEILDWLGYLASNYKIASTGVYGKSYKGRELKYLKISTGSGRKAVLMDGGIHAREWLAVSTVNYIIEKMIRNYESGESSIRNLLSQYDFYFIPVVNPDGYELTHSPSNRLWRKNARPITNYCSGVDLNRNFDAYFGGVGTSNDPCQDTYRGPYAFSEPETLNFAKFVLSLGSNLKLYIGLHTYAQYWFVPWAYSHTRAIDDEEMRRVANIGNKALFDVNGVSFDVGTPPELLYAAAGGAYDWVKLKAGVKYSYTLELRPRWGSSWNGFIRPISDIKPSGEEVYAGLIATTKAI